MGWKEYLFRIKIFLWYLITEPFRQLKEIGRLLIHALEALNKTRTWIYLAMAAMVISLVFNKKYYVAIFLFFLLFTILLLEWEKGFFMNRYRQKIKKHIKEELEKNERNK